MTKCMAYFKMHTVILKVYKSEIENVIDFYHFPKASFSIDISGFTPPISAMNIYRLRETMSLEIFYSILLLAL